MLRRSLSAGAVGLLLLAVGCSERSGEPSDSPAPAPSASAADPADAGAVRDGLAALYAGDHPGAGDQDAAGCFADELLGRASVSELEAAGVVDGGTVAADVPALPPDVAGDWVDAQLACTDFVAESARAQVAATKGAIDEERYAACLRDAVPADRLRLALVEALTGSLDGPAVAALGRAQADCAAAQD